MPRANRHYIPGHAWHITHRCHKKEFLLKFAKDRQSWLDWLFEAKKRYGMVVLNYMATSNHIHLLIYDRDGGEVIPKSVQLAAGRTAQEYNQRKREKAPSGKIAIMQRRCKQIAPGAVHRLHGFEYGQGRGGQAPLRMATLRLWRDPKRAGSIPADRQEGIDGVAWYQRQRSIELISSKLG